MYISKCRQVLIIKFSFRTGVMFTLAFWIRVLC